MNGTFHRGCRVRRFVPEDAAGLLQLMEACAWGPYRDGMEMSEQDLLRGMEENAFISSFVAESLDGRIVGWAVLAATSVQRASAPGGAFGDHFVIHPDFRNGLALGRFMSVLQTEVAALGYVRIDSAVEVDNVKAMAAYRRVGFRQVTAEPCEDGGYLMENYLPSLMGYLRSVGFADPNLTRASDDPRLFLKVLRPVVGPPGLPDVHTMRGAELVDYTFGLDEGNLTLSVDRFLGTVSAASCPDAFNLAARPTVDRTVQSGNPASVTIEFENLGKSGCGIEIRRMDEAALRARTTATGVVVPAGDAVSVEVPVSVKSLGRRTFEFEVVVDRDGRELRFPLATWLDVVAHPSALDARWWSGARGTNGWSLDLATGVLSARHRDEVVIQELWPDLGPPYPGGHKDPVRRRLNVVEADDQSVVVSSDANVWLEHHPSLLTSQGARELADVTVERRLTRIDETVMSVETTLHTQRNHPGLRAVLRTWPRVVGSEPSLTSPDRARWIDGDDHLPSSNVNFEFLHGVQCAGDAALEQRPWSVFAVGAGAVALVFPGATEVRFGGRWMPSCLYDAVIESGTQRVVLPRYHLVVGDGVEEVSLRCEELVARHLDRAPSLVG